MVIECCKQDSPFGIDGSVGLGMVGSSFWAAFDRDQVSLQNEVVVLLGWKRLSLCLLPILDSVGSSEVGGPAVLRCCVGFGCG